MDAYSQRTIYALGFFDGVHLGHRALLDSCLALARSSGCKAGAVTFTAHPETLVKGSAPALICTAADRRQLLRQQGMETVLELPFDEQLRNMCWRDFVRMLCAQYGAAGFVCGSDFRFGYQGEGTAEILKQYCAAADLPCAVVPEQYLDSIRISSSHIRTLLEQGNVADANRFLGHPYTLSGEVIAGRGLGHTLGFPTANLCPGENAVQLRHGVYACKAEIDGSIYPAVTNVGNRPTVGGHRVTVEAWILDFSGNLYDKPLTLHFYQFLRPEEKFENLDYLKAQIQEDRAQTQKLFANFPE